VVVAPLSTTCSYGGRKAGWAVQPVRLWAVAAQPEDKRCT
jgi:hypothetical protein